MAQDIHVFKGMQRDLHSIRQDGSFMWEAHNIRISSREGSNYLSMTNEKGTKKVDLSIGGTYMGHCVVGKYLVLFTTNPKEGYKKTYKEVYNDEEGDPEIIQDDVKVETYTKTDNIYRISENNGAFTAELLYNKDLNFDVEHSLQTLGVFEGELVQKVYWVDGVNQPRFINVVLDKLKGFTPTEEEPLTSCFNSCKIDFTPKASPMKVEVDRIFGMGEFAPGTIQYSFVYYNKYGQESNILYTTPLYYISLDDRGGRPDVKVPVSFKIGMKAINLDKDFDYLRIYSIHRTSIDSTPTVKQVTDISMEGVGINDDGNVSYIDTGMEGSVVDPALLLYLGGETITANTIAAKDNTLFLGNINIKKTAYVEVPKTYKIDDQSVDSVIITTELRSVNLTEHIYNSFYNYDNQLKYQDITCFMPGDYYRIGLQFQYKDGSWTDPCYIKDYRVDSSIRPSIEYENKILKLPYIKITVHKEALSKIANIEDYNRMRAVVAFPENKDRVVLAQGVLNPTVFSATARRDSLPFAQASWFFRPMHTDGTTIDNTKNVTEGARVASNHWDSLGSTVSYNVPKTSKVFNGASWVEVDESYNVEGPDRNVEIQNMQIKKFADVNTDIATADINTFFVDQNIVTFNSPEIEFDDTIGELLENPNAQVNVIGLIPITATSGDIDIQTSSTVPAPKDQGFFHQSTFSNSDKGLVAGLFYGSHVIDDYKNGGSFGVFEPKNLTCESLFMVYPWNRTTSLNNDVNRPENQGSRTAVLKRKVISNLRVSDDNIYFNLGVTLPTTSRLSVFNSTDISLIKLPSLIRPQLSTQSYYGNIDTLITSRQNYSLFISQIPAIEEGDATQTKDVTFDFGSGLIDIKSKYGDKIKPGDFTDAIISPRDPVRMKYKSTPHVVISMGYDFLTTGTKTVYSPCILPYVSYTDTSSNTSKTINKWENPLGNDKNPYWIEKDGSTPSPSMQDVVIDYYMNFQSKESIGPTDIKNAIYQNIELIKKESCTWEDGLMLSNCMYPPYDTSKSYWKNSKYRSLYRKTTSGAAFTTKFTDIDLSDKEGYVYNVTRQLIVDSSDGKYKIKDIGKTVSYEVIQEDGYYFLKEKSSGTDNTDSADEKSNDTNVQKEIKYEDSLTTDTGYLYLAEIQRLITTDFEATLFGGTSQDALLNTKWLPASEPVSIGSKSDSVIEVTQGDTYYQRYDCLKTYPYTNEDENSIVEILSFMCATKVNIDGRYDRNRGQRSNLNMSPTNFNLLNPVYSQKNNFFTYRKLEDDMYKLRHYPSQVIWSGEKTSLSDVDAWTKVRTANSYDLDGNKGKLTSLVTFNELLVGLQDKAVSQLLFNSRVQIPTSEGVPIEISNSAKMEGVRLYSDTIGCQNRDAIAKSSNGIYFIDYNNAALWKFNGQLTNISDATNNKWWFYDKKDVGDWYINNPDNILKMSYDPMEQDFYINKSARGGDDALCYSEALGNFTSLMSYNGSVMLPFKDKFLSITSDQTVVPAHTERVEEQETTTDESGEHTTTYWNCTEESYTSHTSTLWENRKGDYNSFYGELHLPDFTYISNDNPTYDKIFNTIEFQADFSTLNADKEWELASFKSFDWIRAWNEYQDTGEKPFTQQRASQSSDVSLRKKFRVWRGQLPRVGRERIRNPWTAVQLGFNEGTDNNFSFVLHNIKTGYFI